MSTKTLRTYAIAAAVALSAVAVSAPAFAWGAGAPDSAYDSLPGVNGNAPRGHAYYNYAPGYYDYAPGYSNGYSTGRYAPPDSYGFR